jgi:hypothetical protein
MIPSALEVTRWGVSSPESLAQNNIKLKQGKVSPSEGFAAVEAKIQPKTSSCYGVFVKQTLKIPLLYHLSGQALPNILQSRIMKAALGGDSPQAQGLDHLSRNTLQTHSLKQWPVR